MSNHPRHKERELTAIGTVFKKKYKGNIYELAVVEHEANIAYSLFGKIYKTPTAAAKALVGYKEINGCAFWGIDKKHV